MAEIKYVIVVDSKTGEQAVKSWDKALEESEKKAGKASLSVQELGRSMKDLGKTLAVGGGAVTAALGLLVKTTADAGDAINDMSKRTGVATDTLSGYKLAADKSGASLDSLGTGFRGLANQMQAANNGGDTAKLIFQQLGVEYATNEGKLRPLNDVMLDVADRFANMADGAAKTALAQDAFGRSGMALIPMLNLGAEGLRAEREEAERLGMVFSAEAAAACDQFNDSLANVKGAVSGLSKEIAMGLLPTAQTMADTITNVVAGMRNWAAAHPGLSSAISTTALALGGMATTAGTAIFVLGSLITKLGTVAATLHMTAGALTVAAGAMGALVTATGFYVAKLFEQAAAEDYAAAAGKRQEEVENKLLDSLSRAAVAADWQFGRMSKLIEVYHGNVGALAMAIQKGKEGVDIQKALAEVGREDAKAYEEWLKQLNRVPPALVKIKTTLAETAVPVGNLRTRFVEYGETLVKTAVPAHRELALAMDKVATPEHIDATNEYFNNLAAQGSKATKDVSDYFAGLYNDIVTGFADTLKTWMSGASTFEDFMKGIWGNIKDAFFTMVSEMAVKWAMGFLKDIVSSTTKAMGDVAKGATNLVSTVGNILSGGLAAGIGAFAGTFLGTLLGGGGGNNKDITYWLKMIKDNSQILVNYVSADIIDMMHGTLDGTWRQVDQNDAMHAMVNGWLGSIESNTRGLKAVTAAQTGFNGLITRPTMFIAGEKGPERVMIQNNRETIREIEKPAAGAARQDIHIYLDGREIAADIQRRGQLGTFWLPAKAVR